MNGMDPWRSRSVLVTGAGGFIASGLVNELLHRGAHIVGIVRDSPGARLLESFAIADRIDLVRGSITDEGLIDRVINEYAIDTVFHLAAQTLVGVANASPISTFESNIAGTWKLLEACRHSPSIERVVVASSDKAYGNQKVLPYTEETTLAGLFPYDASKVCTDVLTQCYAASYGLPAAILRCANIYGPGDLNWSRLVPGTIRSVVEGIDPVVRSDGTPERDYLYLSDAIAGYLAVADHLPDVSGEAFNFGTNTPVAALAVVDQIIQASGADSLTPQVLGTATNEIDRQALNSDKARAMLGWEPKVSLASGFAQSIDWYRGHLGAPTPTRQEVGV